MEERKRRPPFAVHLREEHQKLQTRPSSLVPEHGPILGKADQRREGGEYVRRRRRERSEQLDDALSLHSPTIFCPRSGTGATQSYWHREAILAAEGDWRFFITLHAPLSTVLNRTLDNALSLGSYRQPTTHNLQRFLQAAKQNWHDE